AGLTLSSRRMLSRRANPTNACKRSVVCTTSTGIPAGLYCPPELPAQRQRSPWYSALFLLWSEHPGTDGQCTDSMNSTQKAMVHLEVFWPCNRSTESAWGLRRLKSEVAHSPGRNGVNSHQKSLGPDSCTNFARTGGGYR